MYELIAASMTDKSNFTLANGVLSAFVFVTMESRYMMNARNRTLHASRIPNDKALHAKDLWRLNELHRALRKNN